jgi:23S rRNA pseudouridine2605 synthase
LPKKEGNGRPAGTRHGLARILSKRGLCSRREAALWIAAGRVSVGGKIVRDPGFPVREGDAVAVDEQSVGNAPRVYIALNKPRGLVTTASDEQGRDTVYRCLEGAGLPWLAPVGRLDKASEGLLLLGNDPAWAARITDPRSGPDKTYHVQVDRIPTPDMLAAMEQGVGLDNGEVLRASAAKLLRTGQRNAWLEIVLDEGRNRQIRRLLQALDIGVLRLVRVAIGGVALGTLAKGAWRPLSPDEVKSLAAPGG